MTNNRERRRSPTAETNRGECHADEAARTGRRLSRMVNDSARTVDVSGRPLFIPLKTEYFEAFKAGTKDTEYRRHGERWNEDVCKIGRPVVLSKGYGKSERLSGVITGFNILFLRSDDFVACYGSPGWAACIQIRVQDSITGDGV